MKTGHKCFFPSTRNDLKSHLSLLEECQCDVLLRPRAGALPVLAALREERQLQLIDLPDLEEFLAQDDGASPEYPYTMTYDVARLTPCMVIHTSGSTGLPRL